MHIHTQEEDGYNDDQGFVCECVVLMWQSDIGVVDVVLVLC